MNELKQQLPLRLESKIERGEGCWIWTGRVDRAGYGRLSSHVTSAQAHRQVYEALIGPIPDGLELDHTCHTADKSCVGGDSCPHRRCVNPRHLEPVTRAENARRSAPAQKTECVNGHPYTPENTYLKPEKSRGRRGCRACVREATRRYEARKKGATR
ncbi:HNH endonuclease signature motif containing protein [Streptomyces misionensis]|uniref:HNH endonuclease signature motif containing protein n=1 Tax=Streptomyces misionensis TaxID=67331 RepID=UPI00343BE856